MNILKSGVQFFNLFKNNLNLKLIKAMSEESSDFTPQIVLSVLGGTVILISEVLPFIKTVKSNGILQLLVNTCKTVYNKRLGNVIDIENGLGETEPLLHGPVQIREIENGESSSRVNSLEIKIDNLNSNLHSISSNLYSCVSDIQTSRQLKLQPIELYELNYIINYIKVNYPKKTFQTKYLSKSNKQLLISQGYIVDYDSHTDVHVIKW
jgi:hypothetical protein